MPQYKFLLNHAQNFPTEGVPPSPFAYSGCFKVPMAHLATFLSSTDRFLSF